MENRLSRKAHQSELDQIYMMGFDVWAEGACEDYLTACRSSPKYKRGTWYVLETENGHLITSLIVYALAPDQFGIGSIATPKHLRRQGNASQLISDVIRQIEQASPGATIFLYADIGPDFYERFNFARLPPHAQRYGTTTCMVRGENTAKLFSDNIATPEYF